MGVEWWITDGIKNRYGAECQRLNIRTAELRAEVNRLMTTLSRSPENVELLLDMIRRCQTLDQHHVTWINELPEYFRFKAVAWEDHVPNGNYALAEVFPGRVDAYQDLWVVSVWNLMRCSRIILASLIVRCAAWVCSPVDYRTTPEYATAARACVDMITDIIASVPYQLGWFSKRKELLERANLSAFGCGEEDALKGLPGYFLTWPLTCVQGQDYTTDAQRAWVKGRLQFIGNQLGVRYANILNQVRDPRRSFFNLRTLFFPFHISSFRPIFGVFSFLSLLFCLNFRADKFGNSLAQPPCPIHAHPPGWSHGQSLPDGAQL